MATISKNFTFTADTVIKAAEHNANFDTIFNDYNGNITTANLSATAGIVDTQLAQITTASKVAAAAVVGTPWAEGIIVSGLDIATYASAAASVSVNPGVALHGTTQIKTTAVTALTLDTAGNYFDGSQPDYSSKGWNYVGVDSAGTPKLLADNAPDVASYTTDGSQGDTTAGSTFIYFWDSGNTKHWRVIGAIWCYEDGGVIKAAAGRLQQGNLIILDVPETVTTTVSASAWTDGSTRAKGLCDTFIPAISTLGIFGLISTHAGGNAAGVWIRPNGTTWSVEPADGAYSIAGDGSSNQKFCFTDSSQKINLQTHVSDTAVRITVQGYVMNIR